MPVLTGAGAFGLFYAAAQLARHIPPLDRAIGSVLHYADDGSTPLVLATASANAVAEELFFRGALWSLVAESHPVIKTTLAYAASTAATRNPALVLAGTATSVLFGLQRRTSGGIMAPALSHLTWSLLMLRYLRPCSRRPGGLRSLATDPTGGVANGGGQCTSPTQNQTICARQPMGPAQLSGARIRCSVADWRLSDRGNPLTLRGGHRNFLRDLSGPILMAAHIRPGGTGRCRLGRPRRERRGHTTAARDAGPHVHTGTARPYGSITRQITSAREWLGTLPEPGMGTWGAARGRRLADHGRILVG